MERAGGIISSDVEVPAASQELYSKTVGDMVEDGMKVFSDGTVEGTFKYVTGYTGFNESVPAEQEGYFFPFTLKKAGTTMTFIKNGVPTKEGIPYEADNVFRVTKTDTFEVKVDDVSLITFNFANANFEQTEQSLNAMTVSKIKMLAKENGYKITKSAKTDVINQFLEAQNV